MRKNVVGFGLGAALFALCFTAKAQEQARIWKIGVLVSTTSSANKARDEALRQGLRVLGYVEGQNIVMDYRYAQGKTDRLPQLARELAQQKPDVIVVGGTSVAVAAKSATSTIPIVVAGAGDLVEAGLIKSFMYPGGNVTGVARTSSDFFDARLRLLKEVAPKTAQVTALFNPKNLGHERTIKDVKLGAQALGLSFQSVSAQTAGELDRAIAAAGKTHTNVLFILTDVFFTSEIAHIAQAAVKNRLPSVYDRADFVDAGGLMSYGVNLADLTRRAAEYVDQILKGANPGDLTLVQPTKFDLAVNLKTAKQIGVTVPAEVLQRAVKVVK
jgi:putative ABC transport system substrate-binding protein